MIVGIQVRPTPSSVFLYIAVCPSGIQPKITIGIVVRSLESSYIKVY
jgi:hypothetical protein